MMEYNTPYFPEDLAFDKAMEATVEKSNKMTDKLVMSCVILLLIGCTAAIIIHQNNARNDDNDCRSTRL
jgi:hypothetical protein